MAEFTPHEQYKQAQRHAQMHRIVQCAGPEKEAVLRADIAPYLNTRCPVTNQPMPPVLEHQLQDVLQHEHLVHTDRSGGLNANQGGTGKSLVSLLLGVRAWKDSGKPTAIFVRPALIPQWEEEIRKWLTPEFAPCVVAQDSDMPNVYSQSTSPRFYLLSQAYFNHTKNKLQLTRIANAIEFAYIIADEGKYLATTSSSPDGMTNSQTAILTLRGPERKTPVHVMCAGALRDDTSSGTKIQEELAKYVLLSVTRPPSHCNPSMWTECVMQYGRFLFENS